MKPVTVLYALGSAVCVSLAAAVLLYVFAQSWESGDADMIVPFFLLGGVPCCLLLTGAILLFRKAIQ